MCFYDLHVDEIQCEPLRPPSDLGFRIMKRQWSQWSEALVVSLGQFEYSVEHSSRLAGEIRDWNAERAEKL